MKIKCTPAVGTVKTNIVERTIGRAVSIDTATTPFGPASIDLLGDTFHCLYGTELNPLKDDEVSKSRLVNHALMKWLSKDEQFMQTRNRTSGKLILSMIAGKNLYEYLMTDDAIRDALMVQDVPPPPPPSPSPSPSSGGDGEGATTEAVGSSSSDSQAQSVEKAVKRIEQLQNNVIGAQIVANASKKADESAENAESFLRTWGIDPGDVTVTDIEEIMKLVDGNNDKMESIAEMAGRFEGICMNALEKVRESYIGQIVDVHRTQDFTMMFAPELCYLMSPDVPKLIHTRYVSDFLSCGLLGFESRSEGKEFGSLLVMVDGSGSMSPSDGGWEIQAKAIAIGLARALKKDKLSDKEYKLFTFGALRDPFFSVDSTANMKEHFEWAEKFQGGGTDFDNAFREALKQLEQMPDGTDFVFITDGECSLSERMKKEWLRYKSETNTRLLYVDVSGRDNYELHSLCDLYMHVQFDKDGNMDMIADNIADSLASSIERYRLANMDADNSA